HDVGKIAVPEAVLLKPGSLDEAEVASMQRHAVEGERICGPLRSTAHYLPIVRHHHERVDGHGYPDRLAGSEIPLGARLVAVAVAGVLLAGVAAQEVTTRVGRLSVRFALGVVGDVVAASLAVVLLADRAALVPAVLLWPIFSGGLVLAEPALIFVASVEVLLLFGAAIVLRAGALPLEQAAGWSVLLFVAAAANGELIRRFRGAQRVTELGFARAADLV